MKRTLIAIALSVGLFWPAQAAEIEVVWADSDVDGQGPVNSELDDTAEAVAIRYFRGIGNDLMQGRPRVRNRIAWDLGGSIERLETDDTDLGAICLDMIVRMRAGVPRAHFFLTGGLGGVFSDFEESVEEITIESPDSISNGNTRNTTETETIASIQDADQSIGVRWVASAGVRGYFNSSKTFGMSLGVFKSGPVGEDFVLDENQGFTLTAIFPAGH